jgi:hypothetical protein
MATHVHTPGGLSPFPRTGGFLAAAAILTWTRGSARTVAGPIEQLEPHHSTNSRVATQPSTTRNRTTSTKIGCALMPPSVFLLASRRTVARGA